MSRLLFHSRYLVILTLVVWAGSCRQAITGAFIGTQTASSQSGIGGGGPAASSAIDDGGTTDVPVDFGPNVLVFDATMDNQTIQSRMDTIHGQQVDSEFSANRYAYLFKPGSYNLDVQIGYYMTAQGLGASPDDTLITGAVRCLNGSNGTALINFWRGIENFAVNPTQDAGTLIWAVSQGASLRRMHVKGNAVLSDQGGYSSGGFIADSKFDTGISSGTQQQFFLRNSALTQWQGGTWNMVFSGCSGTPSGSFPSSPYVVIDSTPPMREKPFLAVDKSGNFVVMAPPLKSASQGPTWTSTQNAPRAVAINHFYIAKAGKDTAQTINAALAARLNLIFTPGIYELDRALEVTRANTIVLGLGLATLKPTAGTAAMNVANVPGVTLAGLLFDASDTKSDSLLVVGAKTDTINYAVNPTQLHDVYCRVGGAGNAQATTCFTINLNDTRLDNLWLWRADHGDGAGWDTNPCDHGLVVNGSNVIATGLLVEHFENYQTLWMGEGGQTYFYQSEIPYDVPNQSSWTHDGVKGFASFKLGANVTQHTGRGMGAYCVFDNAVQLENAFETPTSANISLKELTTIWLGRDSASAINHIINGTGSTVRSGQMKATSAN